MKRILLLLAFFSCFLICSMSIIPSAQSSMVKDDINRKVESRIEEIKDFTNNVIKLLINSNRDILNILEDILLIILYFLCIILYFILSGGNLPF